MADERTPLTSLALWFNRSNYTQKAVAAVLGITEAHLSHLVAGNRQPSLPLAIAISELTGLPVQELVAPRRPDRVA